MAHHSLALLGGRSACTHAVVVEQEPCLAVCSQTLICGGVLVDVVVAGLVAVMPAFDCDGHSGFSSRLHHRCQTYGSVSVAQLVAGSLVFASVHIQVAFNFKKLCRQSESWVSRPRLINT